MHWYVSTLTRCRLNSTPTGLAYLAPPPSLPPSRPPSLTLISLPPPFLPNCTLSPFLPNSNLPPSLNPSCSSADGTPLFPPLQLCGEQPPGDAGWAAAVSVTAAAILLLQRKQFTGVLKNCPERNISCSFMQRMFQKLASGTRKRKLFSIEALQGFNGYRQETMLPQLLVPTAVSPNNAAASAASPDSGESLQWLVPAESL